MAGIPIIPKALQGSGAQLDVSPGIISGDHIFLTGMTGSLPDGTMPDDPATQFLRAFSKIDAVLSEAGAGLASVVEMTSYHVGLHDHFEVFDTVRLDVLTQPYPAWTAVEVSGLRRAGALVEIRAIARLG